ncbi:MAG TPA: SLBB domain-containing protein [Syntrophorhabdaceae bacterium]|nr:SLBB domain-containing protein [Syntrophorhabdaceae bacterium]
MLKNSFFIRIFFLFFILCIALFPPSLAVAQKDYVIGPEDELAITVWDHPDLSRKLRVNLEGKISFPLIGEVHAAGLTPIELENKLKDLLSNGYIVEPQINVIVTEYRSQKIFIIGEVNAPGSYPLTKRTSIVEAISMAGGVKSDADLEIMIVRPKSGNTKYEGAISPDKADPSDVIKVRLRDVLDGEKAQNIEVQNMDTIFVPKIKVIYVTGEVKRPGQYTMIKNMTILNAISTAGGFTDKAARKKVRVVREKDGKKVELTLSMDSLVEPGDTIVVPESFW